MFFNQSAYSDSYTLSLHDALPISALVASLALPAGSPSPVLPCPLSGPRRLWRPADTILGNCSRSEEHTSELQSRGHLVCRLLLEKKKSEAVGTSISDAVRPALAGS